VVPFSVVFLAERPRPCQMTGLERGTATSNSTITGTTSGSDQCCGCSRHHAPLLIRKTDERDRLPELFLDKHRSPLPDSWASAHHTPAPGESSKSSPKHAVHGRAMQPRRPCRPSRRAHPGRATRLDTTCQRPRQTSSQNPLDEFHRRSLLVGNRSDYLSRSPSAFCRWCSRRTVPHRCNSHQQGTRRVARSDTLTRNAT